MVYEQFKEQFTEDLKKNFEAKGHEIANIDIATSQKLNQDALISYPEIRPVEVNTFPR